MAELTFTQDAQTGTYTASLAGHFERDGFSREAAARSLARYLITEYPDVFDQHQKLFEPYATKG